MKTITFKDNDGTEITVSHSSLATQNALRLSFSGKMCPPIKMKDGTDLDAGLHLTQNQVTILIASLQDFSEDWQ